MKLEFKTDPSGALNANSQIYITKGEFVRSYEADRMRAYNEFRGICEMFQTPACYYNPPSIEWFDGMYKCLKKATYIGLILASDEDEKDTDYFLVRK